MPLPKSLKVPVYFTLWYLLNIAYNILNKKSMNAYTLPCEISASSQDGPSVQVGILDGEAKTYTVANYST